MRLKGGDKKIIMHKNTKSPSVLFEIYRDCLKNRDWERWFAGFASGLDKFGYAGCF
jgi:hypothetical protein